MSVTPTPVTTGEAASESVLPSATWRMLSDGRRPASQPRGLDALWEMAAARAALLKPRQRLYLKRAERVLELDRFFAELTQEQLREQARGFRDLFRRGRETKGEVEKAVALVREVARRELGLAAHRPQVAGALAMHEGCIVEVATGEGKTLAATMPATLAGWRGRGCHVITVNDYLARRDAQWMGPVYEFCGLSVAAVTGEMRADERRAGYGADITYCTNKEVCADYLRDRLTLGRQRGLSSALLGKYGGGATARLERLVMRGLEHAIVDEADSVLIDEAVTPLIISGDGENEERTQAFTAAGQLAEQLEVGRDYQVDQRYQEVRLTERGRSQLEHLCVTMGGVWRGRRRREELVAQALTARCLFQQGKQYVLQEGKVVIVDEFTGRLMPDRTWRDGLHQAMEVKEKLTVQAAKETLARVSFQRFFRLYRSMSGMTGTAWEARHELWRIYGRATVRMPTHRVCVRREEADRVFVKEEAKWQAVLEQIKVVHGQGRPILVGTRSVRTSERLSGMLKEAGLAHQVLNAVRHAEEAAVVAKAGEAGRITVATNMAGRGTDIKLGSGVAERGGLHVIVTERHEARRVDRQLFGRAGRQGDPGSAATFASMEDELLVRHGGVMRRAWWRGDARGEVRSALARWLLAMAQWRSGRLAAKRRREVLRADDWLAEHLGFAGAE